MNLYASPSAGFNSTPIAMKQATRSPLSKAPGKSQLCAQSNSGVAPTKVPLLTHARIWPASSTDSSRGVVSCSWRSTLESGYLGRLVVLLSGAFASGASTNRSRLSPTFRRDPSHQRELVRALPECLSQLWADHFVNSGAARVVAKRPPQLLKLVSTGRLSSSGSLRRFEQPIAAHAFSSRTAPGLVVEVDKTMRSALRGGIVSYSASNPRDSKRKKNLREQVGGHSDWNV